MDYTAAFFPLQTMMATRNNLLDLIYSVWAYVLYLGLPTFFFVSLIVSQFIWKASSDILGVDLNGWLFYYNNNF